MVTAAIVGAAYSVWDALYVLKRQESPRLTYVGALHQVTISVAA